MLTPGQLRVLVAEDHPALRMLVVKTLKVHAHIQVIGETWNGEDTVALVGQLKPDVVVMDINMPRMNGVEATQRIKKTYPTTIVIGLTVIEDDAVVAAMREAGAFTVVNKVQVLSDLNVAIQRAVSQRDSAPSS
jgi:DNA-binding NarL/FixJ family response regulator